MSFVKWKTTYLYFFITFILMSTIFCGVSRVNILFHVASTLFLLTLVFSAQARQAFWQDKSYLLSLAVVVAFAIYYSLSNLWSTSSHLDSSLTHSFYLLVLMALYRQAELAGYKKYVIAAAWLGTIILAIFTIIYVDKSSILHSRLKNGFPWAPDNVIDLGGYMALGIIFSTLLMREFKSFWFLIPIPFLLLCLVLSQSRGPLMALIVASATVFTLQPKWHFKQLAAICLLIIFAIIALYASGFLDTFINRIDDSYQQSFVRFGIWQHAYNVAMQHPIFGWGFNKELAFVNSIGQHVTTTHSLYFAALLKGGFVGFALFISVIGLGLWRCKVHFAMNQKAEVAILLFSLVFYSTQGMFVISNPREYWVLFWLPLTIVMSTPAYMLKK
uniref:O-antigen ligase family protein n=1 Tax=Scandinavium goeteborgense TaxID=1851514 RepID=UPI0013581D85|nr:O-antigen ligase family protein [Scandinavium goeteborgense]